MKLMIAPYMRSLKFYCRNSVAYLCCKIESRLFVKCNSMQFSDVCHANTQICVELVQYAIVSAKRASLAGLFATMNNLLMR